jgi:glutamate synthase (NADPH/NADH) large chain
LKQNCINLDEISSGRSVKNELNNYQTLLNAFGYSKEDVERLILPMANDGFEPTSSMGNDVALSVFSDKPQRLFNYFRQQFAQVTNPPIDPIREELVMSLTGYIGSVNQNLLEPANEICKMVKLKSPVITNSQFDILMNLNYKGFYTISLPMLFDPKSGAAGLEKAIQELCLSVEKAVDDGKNYIVLSDRGVDATHAPIPSLLAVSAVHLYLVQKRKRMQIDIVVESAEPREVMHFALLFGFGANAVNPYMVFAIINDRIKEGDVQMDMDTAKKHYIKAVNKGLLKVLSKMGNSTLRSYRGAHIFEAIGISSKLLEKYFTGVTSAIQGIDIYDVADEVIKPHFDAYFPVEGADTTHLKNLGEYAYRNDGEKHAWNPETIARLQIATKTNDYQKYKEYVQAVDDKATPIFIRDLMDYKRNPIDINEVEPIENITKRFVTGAMSYGSISREAHEAMAMAMNILGGRSNTGEGGEDPERYKKREDGLITRSAIKQVASGRFGVTAEYLVNADEIQIKIAQGAKPGEGGQLPGHKVDKIIAKTRHSIPGISLISPPPHHDIYSIEDLAQLIYDLKNINPTAMISVKLVSETGVGTIAAGVAKAKADLILISGAEGGTGASPSSSIKHAGLPMEIGLAETQQTLVLNNLRGQIKLQADGQLKTGRDIIMSALLGAEEYGFATSALLILGCVMMRKCHLNTCPVGVATQDEVLRKHFTGKHEYLVNFFKFIAEDVREHLAQMGFRSLDEIIGHAELLERKNVPGLAKIDKVDLTKIMFVPTNGLNALRHIKDQDHKLDAVLDRELIKKSLPALDLCMPVQITSKIKNTDRTVGAMLSGEIAKRYGQIGLPEDTIKAYFNGSAGQSFGAFLSKGIYFELNGEANDYVGKGLSGGKIVVKAPKESTFKPEENIIAGNTILYGATSGEVYINGVVGERFCVRNSGAIAVVEGAGDHCCEYMTGGRTVVLGQTGRNFAAGMSGGVAYVLDEKGDFDFFCNMEMVELSLIEDSHDSKEVQGLIANHLKFTGSIRAKQILDNWSQYVDKFKKIVPIEYKKVLQEEKMEAINKKIAQVERDY